MLRPDQDEAEFHIISVYWRKGQDQERLASFFGNGFQKLRSSAFHMEDKEIRRVVYRRVRSQSGNGQPSTVLSGNEEVVRFNVVVNRSAHGHHRFQGILPSKGLISGIVQRNKRAPVIRWDSRWYISELPVRRIVRDVFRRRRRRRGGG